MAEVLAEFDYVFAADGTRYQARGCGGPMDDGLWQGWIELEAPDVAAAAALPPGRPAPNAVLDPFSVYQKGEEILRKQLGALSSWHLVNILRAEALTTGDPATLNQLSAATLVELIVAGVRRRTALLTGA